VPAGGGSSQVTPVGGVARTIALGGTGPLAFFRTAIFDPPSPLSVLQARLPGTHITWVDGRYPRQAALLAARADAAIVFAQQWSAEATDLPDLSLPSGQDALIDAVSAANSRTIVVLQTAGPVLMPWRARAAAILEAWYPGNAGADAIADVLFGDVDPSGRLPVTFPAAEADLPNATIAGMHDPPGTAVTVTYPEGADAGYRWYARSAKTPLYPFGFGLSYSRFALANLRLAGGASLLVSFDVSNIGARAGMDVPQVYVTSRGGRAGLRLIGWSKRALAAGETQHVTLTADPRLLADFIAAPAAWHIPAGDYAVAVGENAADRTLTGTVHIDASDVAPTRDR
jgi:beta-glucosidase